MCTVQANEMKRLTDSRVQRKAANVAARVAVGGDDLTLRWQVMAKKAQQKSDGAFGKSFVVQQSKDMKHMRSPTSGRRVGDSQELHAKGISADVGDIFKFLIFGWKYKIITTPPMLAMLLKAVFKKQFLKPV